MGSAKDLPQHPRCHPGTRVSLNSPRPLTSEERKAKKEKTKLVAPDVLLARLADLEDRLDKLERKA